MKFKFDSYHVKASVCVIATYIAQKYTPQFWGYVVLGRERFNGLSFYHRLFLCHGTTLLLCFLTTYYLASFSFKKMLEMLGLNKGLAVGFAMALVAALPHLLGMQYLYGFNKQATFVDVWANGIHPGYNEELFYRGFLAGILVRYAKWPTLIPLAGSSLLFAAGHLYQAHNVMESVIVFCTAMAVGTGFFMLYKYANWNLWYVIFLHSFMDTATVISNWHGNITMSAQDNIFRGSTILIAIYFCYRITKRKIIKKGRANSKQ